MASLNPIFFPYETKNREFDGKILLISHLLNHFDTIFLGSRKSMKREALAREGGIYFLKSLAREEEPFYRKLVKQGYRIILLHAEGGIHYRDNRENILSAYNPDLLGLVSRNYLYGPAVKESVDALTGDIRGIVTGEPRFDLLKEKYRSYFQNDLRVLEQTYGPYFLVNTNFGLANSFVGAARLEAYYSTEKTLTPEARELLLFRLHFQKDLVQEYLEMLRHVAAQFPDIRLIIRPHPSESEEEYRKIGQDHPNVSVEKKGNVAPWILGARAVIHYDCTTGMEAALAGIPVLSYLPIQDPRILAWLPVELSDVAPTRLLLTEKLKEIVAGSYTFHRSPASMEDWVSFVHNAKEESSPLITSDLSAMAGSKVIPYRPPTPEGRLKLWYGRMYSDLKRIKDRLTTERSITREKFGETGPGEIREKLSLLREIEGFHYSFRVTRISNDVFQIRRK